MNKNIINRLLLEGRYIISLNKNIKELSEIFKISKSTVYRDINLRMKEFDNTLYQRVINILKF